MINFRFHVVSLVGIFLALALGVVIGAGVIDRGVVDTLNGRLDQVENRSARIAKENSTLSGQIDELGGALASVEPYVVESRLIGENIGIVAVRGQNEDQVKQVATVAGDAGANVTGILWLESKWKIADDTTTKALAAAVGESGRKGAALRTAVWKKVADRLAHPPGQDTSANDDVLGVLESQGFVSFDAMGGKATLGAFPGRGAALVLAVGEQGDVPSKDVIMPATSAIVGAHLSLVVTDAWQATKASPNRGDALDELRADALSRTVSTVDDLDRPQGPLTITLALSSLLGTPPVVGHYGYGSDTKPMPEFARP